MTITLKQPKNAITSPQVVFDILSTVLQSEEPEDRDREHFWVFHLTTCNTIKSLHLVSLGILDRALVHPREVYTRAVTDRCASIVIAHNHPSNDAQPSAEDLCLTKKLTEAGEILGVHLIDHIIVTDTSFYSFRQAGVL